MELADDRVPARVTGGDVVRGDGGNPVDRWRNAFTAVINHIDVAAGKGPRVADADDKGQNQGNLAATEPVFDTGIQGRNVNLSWQNLTAVTIKYVAMRVLPAAVTSTSMFFFCKSSGNGIATLSLPAGS